MSNQNVDVQFNLTPFTVTKMSKLTVTDERLRSFVYCSHNGYEASHIALVSYFFHNCYEGSYIALITVMKLRKLF